MAKKTKAKKPAVKTSLYDKQLQVLQDKFGDSVLQSLTTLSEKHTAGYSTGSLGLDYLISPESGGMPAGYVLEFVGDFSTGKTTLSMGICANVTANNKKVLFIDAERSLRPDLALNAGVKNIENSFCVLKKNDVNITVDIVSKLMKTGDIGVVVVDSIPAWKPAIPSKTEESRDYTNPKIGYHARFLAEVLPDLVDLCSDTDTALILLNQVRANIGSYGGGETGFGGKALDHYVTIRIKLRGKVQQKSAQILDPNTNEPIGQYVTCTCTKNKYALPMKETVVPLILGVGVNPYMELAYLATQKTNIISGIAGRYKWADTEEPIAHGMDNFVQLLYDDVDLYNQIRSKTIEHLKVKYEEGVSIVNPYINSDGSKRNLVINEET